MREIAIRAGIVRAWITRLLLHLQPLSTRLERTHRAAVITLRTLGVVSAGARHVGLLLLIRQLTRRLTRAEARVRTAHALDGLGNGCGQ